MHKVVLLSTIRVLPLAVFDGNGQSAHFGCFLSLAKLFFVCVFIGNCVPI